MVYDSIVRQFDFFFVYEENNIFFQECFQYSYHRQSSLKIFEIKSKIYVYKE